MAKAARVARLVKIPVLISSLVLALCLGRSAIAQPLSPAEELGKHIFMDKRLSVPGGQACITCHAPETGGTGGDSNLNREGAVYPGAFPGRFGNRRPPSAFYAGYGPVLHRRAVGFFAGGLFVDGRATGEPTGDPLAEQALQPFINPLEHNLPDHARLVELVRTAPYFQAFEEVWGSGSLETVEKGAQMIARSLAAYQRSSEFNPFNSKFDDFWREAQKGGLDVAAIRPFNVSSYSDIGLDRDELRGLALFASRARCATCHSLDPVKGGPPLFTDSTYRNLGVPKNPKLPYYADHPDWVDPGLATTLLAQPKWKQYAAENQATFRVPTLRNVDRRPSSDFVKAYMHNGVFKSLEDVVHFYNTRDVEGSGWAKAEDPRNQNTTEMGNLGLSSEEENQLVLFLKTLSDR
jgi:cytochrome c peroxidase